MIESIFKMIPSAYVQAYEIGIEIERVFPKTMVAGTSVNIVSFFLSVTAFQKL